MANGDFQSYLRLLRGFFGEFLSVLLQKSRPPRLALHYNRAFMVMLCLYPNQQLASNPTYKFCNQFALCNLSFFLITVMCAVHESTNVMDMGDDIVWIIGIILILTKIYYIHLRANEIDDVIADFNYYTDNFNQFEEGRNRALYREEREEISRWQRICYLAESGMSIQMTMLLFLFNVAICMQPLFGDKELQFHVMFPFDWHRSDQHPYTHALIYIWICITSQFNLFSICQIDLLGIHTILHTALNLKYLCIELQKLGKLRVNDAQFHQKFCKVVKFHQHIIRTVEKNNRVFHGSFTAQIIASFALISMSTFETMAAADNPKVAAKFVLFMVITFIQLSYWCLAGTLVYGQSMDVAQAAFNINDWHTKSVMIQRNILFVIIRSQKPLSYAAKPLPPFTLATYSIILKQCYRILALLRESM